MLQPPPVKFVFHSFVNFACRLVLFLMSEPWSRDKQAGQIQINCTLPASTEHDFRYILLQRSGLAEPEKGQPMPMAVLSLTCQLWNREHSSVPNTIQSRTTQPGTRNSTYSIYNIYKSNVHQSGGNTNCDWLSDGYFFAFPAINQPT